MTRTEIGHWLNDAAQRLKPSSTQPFLESQIILAHLLEKSKTWIITHPEYKISNSILDKANKYLEDFLLSVPLPYLLGKQEFFGLEFYVSSDTLIPRPETELLVEKAIQYCNSHRSCQSIADIGTGSCCIAASILTHISDVLCIATDISYKTLKIAEKNITNLNLKDRIMLVQGDLLKFTGHKFDLICANLPYIPSHRLVDLDVSKHEPDLALNGGDDGLIYIKELIRNAPKWLSKTGLFLAEIDFEQHKVVEDLAKCTFPHASVNILSDLAGLPRLLWVETSEA